jgi:hypothetical protein
VVVHRHGKRLFRVFLPYNEKVQVGFDFFGSGYLSGKLNGKIVILINKDFAAHLHTFITDENVVWSGDKPPGNIVAFPTKRAGPLKPA